MNFLIQFIQEHEDWYNLLQKDPYNLLIKEDTDYPNVYLFKYNQYESDMNQQICQNARGIILEIIDDSVKILCHSFDKFFNYGEPQGQDALNKFDWQDYTFQEKRDGSLLRIWYYNNKWNVSTSGTIDAYKATVDIPGCPCNSFGDMFTYIFDSYGEDTYNLDKHFTYSFELTSPDNKIVVDYEENELTLIGMRDNILNIELSPKENNPFTNISTAKIFNFTTLDQALEDINNKSNFEGLVLCDYHFNRVKIKSDEYLTLARITDGISSDRGILKLILEDMIDDVIGKAPSIIPKVDIIKTYLSNEINNIKETLNSVDFALSKKEVALQFKDSPYSSFVFRKYDYPDYDFLKEYFTIENIEKIYKDYKNKIDME